MIPEQKAKELVDRFLEEMPRYLQGKLGRETAKESALICVDEMINTDINKDHIKVDGYMYSFIEFYVEVKQEINKL